MCSGLVILACASLAHKVLSVNPQFSPTPTSEIPHIPQKSISTPHKYPQGLDNNSPASYNTSIHIRSVLMAVAYHQAQKQRYRITLDITAFPDFDPHQIDWEKLFKLEPAEHVEAYVEDLSLPDRW